MKGTPIPTAMMFDQQTGAVTVTHPTHDEMISRLIDHLPRAPWLADLATAIPGGLAYVMAPAPGFFPVLRHDLTRAFLFVAGDDLFLAQGPQAFHGATLRKLLKVAVWVGVAPGKPERAFYGAAIAAAMQRKRPAVLVETQSQERDAWTRWLARYAKVPIEICGQTAGKA